METAYNKCRNDLTNILENSEFICLNETGGESVIDQAILFELKEKHPDYLVGNDYNLLTTRVLLNLQEQKKVFQNGKNKFKIQSKYHPHSIRYFIAIKEEN